MRRILTFAGALAILLGVIAAAPSPAAAQAPENVTWNVQYYNNPFLTGTPVVDTTLTGRINFEWGLGSPRAEVSADNFSIRFGQFVYFEPGTYRFSLRADDQARISIDENTLISTLNGGQIGQTLTADIALSGGHQIQIDYREFTGIAYLIVDWERLGPGGQPAGTPTATVRVATLNVRQQPTTDSPVLTRVNAGQTYAIVGRSVDQPWVQINVNGTIGWVYSPLVTITNVQNVPGTAAPQQPTPTPTQPATGDQAQQPTGFTATTLTNLSFRSSPNVAADNRIAVIPAGTELAITGRNAQTSWLRVNFNNQSGWVAYNFVNIQPPLILNQVPVVQ